MRIGPGARENEVSAATASTRASVPPPDRRRPGRAWIVAEPAQDRDARGWFRHRSTGRISHVLEDLLRLLVPAVCLACRRTAAVTRADPLCHPCRLALPWLTSGPRCARCGLPEAHAAGTCPARAQAFTGAW